MTIQKTFRKAIAGILMTALGTAGLVGTGIGFANAASLTSLSDSQSSVKAAAVTNHDISFVTPTGITVGQTIVVAFSSSTVMNASLTFADVDIQVNGVQQTLAGSNGASTWGVVRTNGSTLTITAQSSGTPAAAGNTIRIKIGTNTTNQSVGTFQTTNDSAGTQIYYIGGGTFADAGSLSVNLITNDTVAVTGTVNQSISFAILSATSTAFSNSIYFGTLAAGTPKFASSTNTSGDTANGSVAHVLTVGTNAPSGYTLTVQGQTLTSLQNAANTIDAAGASSVAIASSTEMFGITATKSGGVNGTIASQFATANQFGYNATATTSVTLASGTTPTATETYSLKYIASITALTEAGSYSSSLVYVATANF
jgi:hypothetical protein